MVDLWDTQMDIPWALQMEAGAVEMMEYLLVDLQTQVCYSDV